MAMRERGQDCPSLWIGPGSRTAEDALVEDLTRNAAHGLAHAIGAAAGVIDFEAAMPAAQEGSVGRNARVVGAASLPLSERFFVIAGGSIALS